MPELKVGIFGCGRMGRERARCARSLGAAIVAVHDSDPERSIAMAAEYGCRAAITFEKFPWTEVDAVFFCTPPNCREIQALAAVNAQVAFLAEKPVGLSQQGSERVLTALSCAPVVNAVGYMNRCRASILYGKLILESCTLLGLAGFWICKKYSVPWWLDEGASGGPLNEQATHLFDLCRVFGGDITSVNAVSTQNNKDAGQSLGSANAFRFSSGSVGTVLYSCQSNGKDIGLHLFTDRGSMQFSGWDFQMMTNSIDGTLPLKQGEDIFLVETEMFLTAVRSGDRHKVACDWQEAIRTQAVVDAARHSLGKNGLSERVLCLSETKPPNAP